MQYESLIYEKEKGIGIITLNRPKALNSIDNKLLRELHEVVTQIENDPEVRVVIVTGGDKCFSAGADIKEIHPRTRHSFLGGLWRRIERLEKPVIAAISGYALGGGLQFVDVCDLRIASETAKFGLPEIKIGSGPGSGGMQRLPRTIGIVKAKEMLLTGEPIDANEAYRVGLVNKVVPVASLMDEAKKMANTLLQYADHALRIAKKCVDIGMQMDLNSALDFDWAYHQSEMLYEGQELLKEKKREFAERSKESD